jgi:type IX secretion system substrate protein
MKRGCFRFVSVLFVISLLFGNAIADYVSPAVQNSPALELKDSAQPIGINSAVPGPYTNLNLDEEVQMGDTLVIATNWRDQQHNCTVTRMMAYDVYDGVATAYFTWTHHDDATNPRHVSFSRVYFDDDGNAYVDDYNGSQVGAQGAGYTSIDLALTTSTTGDMKRPFVSNHQFLANDNQGWVYAETSFLQGFFNNFMIENPSENEAIWANLSVARNSEDGLLYAHGIINAYTTNDERVYYWKTLYDEASDAFSNVTPDPDNGVTMIFDKSKTLSTGIVASQNSDKVTIFSTYSRFLERGSLPAPWETLAIGQTDNDVVYWTSDDAGVTWDWNNPTNVTSFVNIDESFLPGDTTAANQDSLRAYCEVNAVYDAADVLHMTFNVCEFDHIRELVYNTSRIFYWNSQEQNFHQIADATFWNGVGPAAWEKQACHQQLYIDPETDIIWCLYKQNGETGDTTAEGRGFDASDDLLGNADIYISASPDMGKHWAKGVNVTRTRTLETDLVAGDCRNECDPCISANNEGDYLNFFYTLDFDAGISAITGTDQAEGEVTENQMVYHRVLKSALIDSFDVVAEWIPNYPIHYDGTTGYWEDGNGWAYTTFDEFGTSVQDNGVLTPNEFELQQNYPNPFNPSTQIAFNLKKAGVIQLAVYDILGREVAQLVNRSMNAGDHKITFIAEDLPSGVYFYKLTSGSSTQTKKMVLMK